MKTSKREAITLSEKQKGKETTLQVDRDWLARSNENSREATRQSLERDKIRTIEKQTASMEAIAYFNHHKDNPEERFQLFTKSQGRSLRVDRIKCEAYGQLLTPSQRLEYYVSLKVKIVVENPKPPLNWSQVEVNSYLKWCDVHISLCQPGASFSERAVSDSTSAKKTAHNSFVKAGEVWEIEYKENKKPFTDKKGLHYIQHLLKKPNEEIHVTELHGLVHGASVDTHEKAYSSMTDEELEGENLPKNNAKGFEIIDDQYKKEIKKKLSDFDKEIEEAESLQNWDEVELLKGKREELRKNFLKDIGKGGSTRKIGSKTENIRITVQKTIARAVESIEKELPELGTHLRATIDTGLFCCYQPDPEAHITWRF